jgi:hypothetical protein
MAIKFTGSVTRNPLGFYLFNIMLIFILTRGTNSAGSAIDNSPLNIINPFTIILHLTVTNRRIEKKVEEILAKIKNLIEAFRENLLDFLREHLSNANVTFCGARKKC